MFGPLGQFTSSRSAPKTQKTGLRSSAPMSISQPFGWRSLHQSNGKNRNRRLFTVTPKGLRCLLDLPTNKLLSCLHHMLIQKTTKQSGWWKQLSKNTARARSQRTRTRSYFTSDSICGRRLSEASKQLEAKIMFKATSDLTIFEAVALMFWFGQSNWRSWTRKEANEKENG